MHFDNIGKEKLRKTLVWSEKRSATATFRRNWISLYPKSFTYQSVNLNAILLSNRNSFTGRNIEHTIVRPPTTTPNSHGVKSYLYRCTSENAVQPPHKLEIIVVWFIKNLSNLSKTLTKNGKRKVRYYIFRFALTTLSFPNRNTAFLLFKNPIL